MRSPFKTDVPVSPLSKTKFCSLISASSSTVKPSGYTHLSSLQFIVGHEWGLFLPRPPATVPVNFWSLGHSAFTLS